MQLRDFNLNDAKGMLQWFKDNRVTKFMHGNYDNLSLKDAEHFILVESKKEDEVHKAIVTDEDEYVGTVSLRHIDLIEETAELAIVVQADYFAKGRDSCQHQSNDGNGL